VLELRRLEQPDADVVLGAMLNGVRQLGLVALPWSAAAKELRARMQFARKHDLRAEKAWPAVDDASLLAQLESWLGPC